MRNTRLLVSPRFIRQEPCDNETTPRQTLPDSISSMTGRPYLLDVSRIIWRVWTGRLPTGIDRVCLAYLEHFGPRSRALVQRGEFRLILDPDYSARLFALLRSGARGFRPRLAALLARAVWRGRTDFSGMVYLNIGHTGLNAPGLPGWLLRNRLRPVYLVHDLIPITHPEFCRAGEQQRHTMRIRHMLESAQGIIANSAATLEALANFAREESLPLPADRLVAWLGADEHEQTNSGKVDLPGRPYFVMTGTIEARKNHLLLLRVWERLVADLGDDAPELVLVGQRGWEADDVFALLDGSPHLAGHVRELGRCNDEQMLTLLDGAQALLMPSFVEGYGIPVIEALQRGVPVIASDLPVFREIAGDIPLYLDPADGTAWEQAIRSFTQDCPERSRQRAAMSGFHAPTWSDHFARVENWLSGSGFGNKRLELKLFNKI
jgi:glycosyltransferase involved in cell wall biosynthesis